MNQALQLQLEQVKKASRSLLTISPEKKNEVLADLSKALKKEAPAILKANALDLENFSPDDPLYDRLLLTEERIGDIAGSLLEVVQFEDPIGEVLEEKELPNGLKLKKVRVPLGIVAVIYEARPNVTIDIFALTWKSGNACVLKGSRSASHSNLALVEIIHDTLKKHELPQEIACLMTLEREETAELLQAHEYIDILIPRGSKALIDSVRKNSTIPTIETGAGVVHTYFAQSGNLTKGQNIIENAKTRRTGVCNALDTLLIDETRMPDLPELVRPLADKKVEIFADEKAFASLQESYPSSLLQQATEEHFGTEFLSLKMSIKTVQNLDEAIDHIGKFSSKHSEAIISEDDQEIEKFLQQIDAAAVYSNTSTAFTDGNHFGMGAEIGISTQKLHARGPMGLKELTSYKWIIHGDGQTRP